MNVEPPFEPLGLVGAGTADVHIGNVYPQICTNPLNIDVQLAPHRREVRRPEPVRIWMVDMVIMRAGVCVCLRVVMRQEGACVGSRCHSRGGCVYSLRM